jgi:hypothetical protein
MKFDALSSLFDHWPESGTAAAIVKEKAKPPVLGQVPTDPIDGPSSEEPSENSAAVPDEAETIPSRKPLWITAFIVLLLITVANGVWTFREPLLGNTKVRSMVEKYGLIEPISFEIYRDVSKLHLVSRDLHKHPTRAGMLALSVTFVNRSDQAQPYPKLELTPAGKT